MGEKSIEAEQAETREPIDPRSLDVYPSVYNLSEYFGALKAVVELLESERYQTLEGLDENDYALLGWLWVQEKELGLSRERLAEKLRIADKVAMDPNQNRLFQLHGSHWSYYVCEGETHQEAKQTARDFR